jgi:deoxycytidine triphosphate deaminase
MSDLLVGRRILDCKLLNGGKEEYLKHSTYDLTIGQIFPIGQENRNGKNQVSNGMYFLQPRESVLVLSKEEFALPGTITGLATLRTTLTKSGLLALNVGIIDPFFNGPISTTLINFSEKAVPIKIGMAFFRVLFFLHSDTKEFHTSNESKQRENYVEELTVSAYRDFPKSFLNIPDLDNKFYADTAKKLVWGVTVKYWYFSLPVWLFVASLVWYMFSNENYQKFLCAWLKWMKEYIPLL